MGYSFKNPNLLNRALRHRSAATEHDASYERLEFLGDAVLDLVISEYLYKRYPKYDEGKLTKYRASLVNREFLYHTACRLDLYKYCVVDKSVDLKNQATLKKMLAGIIEALIGAIYLEKGLKAARELINEWILDEEQLSQTEAHNYKGQLLELCQQSNIDLPLFVIEHESGPDHAKEYTIAVYIQGEKLGQGISSTKKEAEQQAAAQALNKLPSG